MELSEAREQLKFAEEHYIQLTQSKNHTEFKKWWQSFRNFIATAFNSAHHSLTTLGFSKESHHRQSLHKAKKDKMVRYVLRARDAGFHKIDKLTELQPGYIEFRPVDLSSRTKVNADGSLTYSGPILVIKTQNPYVRFNEVTNRSKAFPTPVREDGSEHDGITLGRAVLDTVSEALKRTESSLCRDKKRQH